MIRILDRDDIDAVRFALAARGKDEYKYLCITNNKITGTDVRRMHRATLNSIVVDDGLYDVLKNNKKGVILDRVADDTGYPSIESFISFISSEGRVVELPPQYVVKGSFLAATIVYLVGANGQAMNPQYILDVCNIIEDRLPCSITITLPSDPTYPILIKQNDSTAIEALIMPITFPEDISNITFPEDISKQLKEEDSNESN